ncbi:MAG: DUF4214 domain-containing protein, partial [Pseudomonadota bacterium]
FWSARLSGANPLSRADLASVFASSVPSNNNNDSLVMDAKVSSALRQLAVEGSAAEIDKAMAQAIQLAEDTARKDASAYDASALSAAGAVPLTQYMRPLSSLYLAVLNRAPDADGMQFWINALTRGQAPLTLQQRRWSTSSKVWPLR